MSGAELKIADRLALDRTRLASERTLMAWVRTALSMITFGFTIYKFLEALQGQATGTLPLARPHGARTMGLALIGIGTFALIVACAQHWKYVRSLKLDPRSTPWDLALIVGCLLGLLGLLIFGSIVLNAGPFG